MAPTGRPTVMEKIMTNEKMMTTKSVIPTVVGVGMWYNRGER